jgi:hypothetical protein
MGQDRMSVTDKLSVTKLTHKTKLYKSFKNMQTKEEKRIIRGS